jgi:hypothetical protein
MERVARVVRWVRRHAVLLALVDLAISTAGGLIATVGHKTAVGVLIGGFGAVLFVVLYLIEDPPPSADPGLWGPFDGGGC